jgi:hypothetical protein
MVCQLRLPEQPGEGDIKVEPVTVNEAETDKMWSFAGTNPGSIGCGGQQTIIRGNLWRFIPAHGNIKTRMSFEHYLLHVI